MFTIKGAQGLLEKLSGEGVRWTSQADSITDEVKKLPRNGLLAAAFIVYLAGASETIRKTGSSKAGLDKKEDDLKLQLSDLEDLLLKELANSEGNILENSSLINSLNKTKEKSNFIENSLNQFQKLQSALDMERGKFLPISVFGSELYFVVCDMWKISSMYRFSLSSFLKLFEKALRSKPTTQQDDADQRIKSLTTNLERLTFSHISRSIFKCDRQMFALNIIHKLHPTLFGVNEWEVFTGKTVGSDIDDKPSDIHDWVPDEQKLHFKQFQVACIPAFQRLLVVQALRPDRLLTAITSFCCSVLGLESLEPSSLQLKKLYDEESSSSEPILFITTPGVDPSQNLRDLSHLEVGEDRYHQVSMGQGQGDLAISLIHKAAEEGGLWLTSEAHSKFPAGLLESCLKVTIEAPAGIKKNLQRIYQDWSPEYIQLGSPIRAQALFALAWFHAVIQERRNYIPQGWSQFYEFSAADLRSSAEIIDTMCTKSQSPQWATLHGLLKSAIYGGRIDDHQDSLKLNTYLVQLFCDDVFTLDGKPPLRKICKILLNGSTNLLQKTVKIQLDAEPIPAFFDMELSGALALVNQIHTDLSSISKLIRGTILLSNNGCIVGGSETARAYLKAVMTKTIAINEIRERSTAEAILKVPLALSNMFNPITFFNAQRQQTSRIRRFHFLNAS
ncbi:hypothetical protein BSLG_004296 [Batrachochytrium salamandrivorans]|nr:hypothetical protein BSLG_004296 [Batrachochytrium salamandrivorans]